MTTATYRQRLREMRLINFVGADEAERRAQWRPLRNGPAQPPDAPGAATAESAPSMRNSPVSSGPTGGQPTATHGPGSGSNTSPDTPPASSADDWPPSPTITPEASGS
jgi:hypothetical protein